MTKTQFFQIEEKMGEKSGQKYSTKIPTVEASVHVVYILPLSYIFLVGCFFLFLA